MIPQDAIRELAAVLNYDGPDAATNPDKLIAHAKDIMQNRSAAWRHFDAEVRRRCKVSGRLKFQRARNATIITRGPE